jgi:hypothetical protein
MSEVPGLESGIKSMHNEVDNERGRASDLNLGQRPAIGEYFKSETSVMITGGPSSNLTKTTVRNILYTTEVEDIHVRMRLKGTDSPRKNHLPTEPEEIRDETEELEVYSENQVVTD